MGSNFVPKIHLPRLSFTKFFLCFVMERSSLGFDYSVDWVLGCLRMLVHCVDPLAVKQKVDRLHGHKKFAFRWRNRMESGTRGAWESNEDINLDT